MFRVPALVDRDRLAAVGCHGSSQTQAVPAAHQTEPFRQGVLMDTFGQWEIRKGLIDHTFPSDWRQQGGRW